MVLYTKAKEVHRNPGTVWDRPDVPEPQGRCSHGCSRQLPYCVFTSLFIPLKAFSFKDRDRFIYLGISPEFLVYLQESLWNFVNQMKMDPQQWPSS